MKKQKTFSEFLFTIDYIVLFLGLITFLIVGIIELEYSIELGIGVIIFTSIIVTIVIIERYKKYKYKYIIRHT